MISFIKNVWVEWSYLITNEKYLDWKIKQSFTSRPCKEFVLRKKRPWTEDKTGKS